eukprot:TRINITY_DN262_c1_g1_i4.p1 TRINITY_DN262_c1_g1~~TRINITY_DN262_c1_g1_i4.p1  ORF type:complete len:698 (+),score=-13.93 TRINITY_DN262_c1_g1_i4:120-2213(+)
MAFPDVLATLLLFVVALSHGFGWICVPPNCERIDNNVNFDAYVAPVLDSLSSVDQLTRPLRDCMQGAGLSLWRVNSMDATATFVYFTCFDESKRYPLFTLHQISPDWPEPESRCTDYDKEWGALEDFAHLGNGRAFAKPVTLTFGPTSSVSVEYHRGHLVPDADIFEDDEKCATYLTANRIPQQGNINSGAWGTLEHTLRDMVRNDPDPTKTYWVFTAIEDGAVPPIDPGIVEEKNDISHWRFEVPLNMYKFFYSFEGPSTARIMNAGCKRMQVYWHDKGPLEKARLNLQNVLAWGRSLDHCFGGKLSVFPVRFLETSSSPPSPRAAWCTIMKRSLVSDGIIGKRGMDSFLLLSLDSLTISADDVVLLPDGRRHVKTWRSNNGATAIAQQQESSKQPQLVQGQLAGQPVVLFNGLQFMDLVGNFSDFSFGFTMFAVVRVRPGSQSSGANILELSSGIASEDVIFGHGSLLSGVYTARQDGYDFPETVEVEDLFTTDGFTIIHIVHDPQGTVRVFRMNSFVTSSPMPVPVCTLRSKSMLGALSLNDGQYFSVDIAELMVFSTALTQPEVDLQFNRLLAKWFPDQDAEGLPPGSARLLQNANGLSGTANWFLTETDEAIAKPFGLHGGVYITSSSLYGGRLQEVKLPQHGFPKDTLQESPDVVVRMFLRQSFNTHFFATVQMLWHKICFRALHVYLALE